MNITNCFSVFKNFFFFLLKESLIRINLFLNLFLFFLLFFKIKGSSYIAFHYNIYYGIDLITEWQKIFIIPAVGLIILILNSILAFFFFQREKIIYYLVLLWTTFIEILFLISGICLIVINS